MATTLPPLPLEQWSPTKDTLHLYAQIVGKVRLAATARRNHWWNVTLYISARGLTTGPLHLDGVDFDLELDFVDHALVGRSSDGSIGRVELHDGLSVAAFFTATLELLDSFGVRPHLNAKPFGVPMTTPFADDVEHAS